MQKILLGMFAIMGCLCFTLAQNSLEKEQLKHEIKQEIIHELVEKKRPTMTQVTTRISLGGKALLRAAELDWKQKRMQADGTRYQDHSRYWSRYNFYLHMDAQLTEQFKLHSRIRTGNKQYSFVTFGGNKDERFNIILDQLYLQWQSHNFIIKLGRQGVGSIWNNQRGALFDIPTHDGISLGKTFTLGNMILYPQLGFFDEKYRNNTSILKHGKIYGASLLLRNQRKYNYWHMQTGIILADHLPNRYENDLAEDAKEGVRYHDGDLASNYKIWTNQAKISFPNYYNLSFTADYYHNFQSYDKNPESHLIQLSSDNSKPDFTNENNGFVGTVSAGNYANVKSLFTAVSYLYMEKYATMDYFAQYDFCRWTSSNIQGLACTLGYRFHKNIATRANFYITKELKGHSAKVPDYKRSANRIRIDLNINF